MHHSGEKAKRRWGIVQLAELLFRLGSEGYVIHSLYGGLVFDNGDWAVIDVGKLGMILPASFGLANDVFKTGGLFAAVFTEERYVVFVNRYFLAIHLCHMRRIRPISVTKAKKRFRQLFLAERKATPSMLYRRQFEECYGMDAKPVPCIEGDFRRHTDGLAIPGPIFDGAEEEDKEEAETFIEEDGAELDEEE